jgi:hypothetical protein
MQVFYNFLFQTVRNGILTVAKHFPTPIHIKLNRKINLLDFIGQQPAITRLYICIIINQNN